MPLIFIPPCFALPYPAIKSSPQAVHLHRAPQTRLFFARSGAGSGQPRSSGYSSTLSRRKRHSSPPSRSLFWRKAQSRSSFSGSSGKISRRSFTSSTAVPPQRNAERSSMPSGSVSFASSRSCSWAAPRGGRP